MKEKLLALLFVLMFTNVCSAATIWDVNGDGQVGLAEAIYALQVVAGNNPTLPETSLAQTTWFQGSSDPAAGDANTIVFLDETHYLHIKSTYNSGGTNIGADLPHNGIDLGTYVWDPTDNSLAVTSIYKSPTTTLGYMIGDSSSTSFAVNGNSATLGGDFNLNKIIGTTNPIVGIWETNLNSTTREEVVLIFLDDSNYMLMQYSLSLDSCGHSGIERGTYTWDQNTKFITTNALVSTMGCWSFSTGTATDNMIEINGNTMTMTEPDGYKSYMTRLCSNNTCNSSQEAPSCDSSHLNLCTTSSSCTNASGNWWSNNTCQATFDGTDLEAIVAVFTQFSNLFSTSLPSASDTTLLGLLDGDTFMDEGSDLAVFVSAITSDSDMIGISFSNISIESMDTQTGVASISFDIVGAIHNPSYFHMIKKGGVWYMQGDQRLLNLDVNAQAGCNYANNTTPTISTGLQIYVEDEQNQGITSVVVSGAGLTTPVTLVPQPNHGWFVIQDGSMNMNQIYLNDTQIGTIAETGEIYTVMVYKGSVLAATYSEKLKKRPYFITELSPSQFPTVTAPTINNLRGFSGGNMTVSWSVPTGVTIEWLDVTIHSNAGSAADFIAQHKDDLLPMERSRTFTLDATTSTGLDFTPTSAGIWLNGWDTDGRGLATNMFTWW